ncbi:MAG TPA: hypothetical protein VGR89_02350, partial [Puia sp.]|nr:hypothetical protein [Puia sp.]
STPAVGSWITINLPPSSVDTGGPTSYGIRYTAATDTVEEFDSASNQQYAPKLVINYSASGSGMANGYLYFGTGSLAAILLILVIF